MITFPYLLSILSFILALVFVAKVLRERRPPGSTMAWLLLIIFMPYVGIPFYLLLGGRKIRGDAKKKKDLYTRVSYSETPSEVATVERILLSSGVPPKTDGNGVTLLEDGTQSFKALMDLIQGAQHFIAITTFIFKNDDIGREVVAALARKAAQGIKVRVLVDGFFMFPWGTGLFHPLKAAGGHVAIFNPFFHVPFRGNSNLRNHRKIVVVDGLKAMVGGTNIAREYIGPAPDPSRWRDISAILQGPSVATVYEIFREDWRFVTKETVPEVAAPLVEKKGGLVQVVPSGPDVPGDPLYDSIVSAIFSAKRRVWVATPYFIPDETLARAMELAARRGVDLLIVVPQRSNHLLADLCRRSYLAQIREAGGRIYYFNPGMMHGKVTLIDDDYALIGSANMDMRSLLFNYEIGIFFYSPAIVEETGRWISSLVAQSDLDPGKERGTLMLDGIGRILGPLL